METQIWDATVQSTVSTPEGGIRVTVKSKHWAGNHPSGTCTRFNAFYNGVNTPNVTGQFIKVCVGGQFDDVGQDDPKQDG